MSELPTNISRQKRNGVILISGIIVTVVVGASVISYYDLPPISYSGLLVPIAILLFFGYRTIAASRDHRALGDERTAELYGKTGLNAFWLLITIIFVDELVRIIPEDSVRLWYASIGIVLYVIYFGYYRYLH